MEYNEKQDGEMRDLVDSISGNQKGGALGKAVNAAASALVEKHDQYSREKQPVMRYVASVHISKVYRRAVEASWESDLERAELYIGAAGFWELNSRLIRGELLRTDPPAAAFLKSKKL